MNNVNKILTLLVLAGLVNSCGSNPFGDSDPLADQPETVKAGEVPSKPKPPPPEPSDEDVLDFDFTPGGYVFREGVETEITITGRSTFPDSLYELQITNLQEYVGAKVTYVAGDKLAGIQPTVTFKWKPPVGFVYADKLIVSLQLMIFTTNHTPNYSRTVTIPFLVYNEAFSVPRILKVSDLPKQVKELDAPVNFRVEVEDRESIDKPGQRPTLLFLSKSSGVSLAPFIKEIKATLFDLPKGIWYFDVSINLTNTELTNSSGTGYFDIVAISRNAVQSNPKNVDLPVWTSVSNPTTTWKEPVTFKIGSSNMYSFTVYDPKGEGTVSVDFETQCSTLGTPSPICSCKPSEASFGQLPKSFLCTIQWDVASTEVPKSHSITYKAKNSSPVLADKEVKALSFLGTIQLN